MRSFITLSLFVILSILSACKDEPKQPAFSQNLLTGRWEIDKAWRNGKQTETLTDTYYEFDEDGKMRTNLTPTLLDDEFDYEFSGTEIMQKSEPPVTYTIENLTDSLLVFKMTINNYPFRLQLKSAVAAQTEVDSTDAL